MKKPTILLVDDEEAIIKSLSGSLEDEGYTVLTAADGTAALELIKTTKSIDITFLDIWLPGMDGLETLKAMKDFEPNLDIIIMTGHGTVNTAVQAVKMGAFDFLEKPFSLDQIIEIIGKIQKKRQISQKNLRGLAKIKPDRVTLVGESQNFLQVKELIQKLALTDDNVLIMGESGTGKEFVARFMHATSVRQNLAMKKFHCASFIAEEVEIELFGYQGSKEPFSRKDGAISRAAGSTIFIDAIDMLPLKTQKRVANFLKSAKKKSLNLRVVAASHKDLERELAEKRFHKELFACFRQTTIKMPPLRKRRSDIPILLDYFLNYFCEKYGQNEKTFEDEALEALVNFDWPGNIKELKNMVEKIVVSIPTTVITLHDLPISFRSGMGNGMEHYYEGYDSMKEAEDAWRRNYLLFHLRKNNRDFRRTATKLQLSESSLQGYIKKYGIVLTKGKKARQRYQRTLKRSMVLSGRGLHSGIKTGLILSPLPPNSGIIFGNISNGETIPAHLEFVESTEFATSLKKGNVTACTIEHFLAVLHAYQISNLLIKINNEVPIMDGSALDFCQLIEDAGIEEQGALEEEIVITERYTIGEIAENGRFIYIEPADKFTISYFMQYPKPVGHQKYTFTLDDEEAFKDEIAPARTFGFLKDIEALEKKGLASGGRLNNFILLDDEKIINTELRFPDEFVRHKILDILGDFYLLGRPIRGKVTASMTGHSQNNALLRLIRDSLHLN